MKTTVLFRLLMSFLTTCGILKFQKIEGTGHATFSASQFIALQENDPTTEEGWDEFCNFVGQNQIDVPINKVRAEIDKLTENEKVEMFEEGLGILIPILSRIEKEEEMLNAEEALSFVKPIFGWEFVRKIIFDYLTMINYGLVDFIHEGEEVWLDNENAIELKTRLAMWLEEVGQIKTLLPQVKILESFLDNPEVSANAAFMHCLNTAMAWINSGTLTAEQATKLIVQFGDIVLFNEEASEDDLKRALEVADTSGSEV